MLMFKNLPYAVVPFAVTCASSASSAAYMRSASSGTTRSAAVFVALRSTLGTAAGGASPAFAASKASSHRAEHKHHLSPARSPGKEGGRGVARSLPREAVKERNSAVTIAQTVWEPRSDASVLQKPSRKKPVVGAKQQGANGVPNTERAAPASLLADMRRSRRSLRGSACVRATTRAARLKQGVFFSGPKSYSRPP